MVKKDSKPSNRKKKTDTTEEDKKEPKPAKEKKPRKRAAKKKDAACSKRMTKNNDLNIVAKAPLPFIVEAIMEADLPVERAVASKDRAGRIHGVAVTFSNAMTLSVQWQPKSYSNVGRGTWESGEEPTFETAAWYPVPAGSPESDVRWYSRDKGREWISEDDGDQINCDDNLEKIVEFATTVAAIETGKTVDFN